MVFCVLPHTCPSPENMLGISQKNFILLQTVLAILAVLVR